MIRPNDTMTLTDSLRAQFGFDSFRPHQEEIIRASMSGRDVFAALPTGGGKSLCYQLPSVLLPGLTVVVSPLIALMHDQVSGALQNGLAAAALNSSLTPGQIHETWASLSRGAVKLLYVSPERIAVDRFRERLGELNVSLFAIDEAHCISEWGHEFRPEYRSLSVIREEFPGVPIAAFTATATPRVQADVNEQLGLIDPLCVRADFDRPEIFYRVLRKEKPAAQILDFVHRHPGEPGIVYRTTRKSTEQTAAHLAKHGITALPYHAGLPDEARRKNQERFVMDDVQVIVATIAFGMGIDKSNVRWILHGDLPRSIEAYYQETGRAARDGEAAEACLLFGPQDLASIRYHIDRMESDDEREAAEWRLSEMLRYANSGVCRRIQLLNHFDQHHPGECGGCDRCTGEARASDRTVEAQKALSAVIRTGERFGAHYLADILTGTETDRLLRFGHDRLPTFGVGSDQPHDFWIGLLKDLEAAGLVRRADGGKSGLVIAPQGREVLFGKAPFNVVEHGRELAPRRGLRAAPRVAATPAGAAHGKAAAELDPEEAERLFGKLRELRLQLARRQGVPPYVVFSDRTLREMVLLRPGNEAELLGVHGVGQAKLARYGEVFLDALREG